MPNEPAAKKQTSIDYVDRVNRAIDYIVANLDQPLKLDVVAKAAHFSPFHFHRIFKSLTGEPLNEFVKRVRLEKSVGLLSQQRWQGGRSRSLTDIALACGFSTSSDFSRCFKQQYGVPPSRFDVATFRKDRRDEWTSAIADAEHQHLLKGLEPGENPDGFEVELRELPARTVAYLRVINSYRPGAVPEAAERLVTWADARGLADGQWLGYMWDDPEIVPNEKCRYDVGLEVPAVPRGDEVSAIEFPAMLVAEVEIRGGIDLEVRALDWLFGTWLPASGYVPAELPCFEAWIGRPFAHGFAHFELKAQIPVERG